MTTGQASVVTTERFAKGIATFKEWMAAITQKQELFQDHYDGFTPNPEDVAAFKRAVEQHGVKALLLGEDWCPDVWRGLPVLCKLAEQSGMEVRMFMRDQNKDIMAEFLKDGEFESIPTIVFYDKDHRYLGHWIERAQLANDGLKQIRDEAFPSPMPERGSDAYNAVMSRYRELSIERAEPWRQAQVKEMRELLEKALS